MAKTSAMVIRYASILQTLLLIVVIVFPVAARAAAAEDDPAVPLVAYNALLVGDDARARLVVDFDRTPEFTYHYLANPARLVITLPATAFGFSDDRLAARGLVEDIRYGATGPGQSRIVLTTDTPFMVTKAEVVDNETSDARLVIDLAFTEAEKFAGLVAEQQTRFSGTGPASLPTGTGGNAVAAPDGGEERFVVAVDAGHGGIDTGAIGEDTKTLEKDITLDFARAFAKALQREPGIDTYLTRDSDVYLSLSKRIELARQHGADLFISLHADSLNQPDISGATVYTLSDKASDRLAAALARRENLSNDIAGIDSADEPEEVTDILLDLTRRETQSFSISLADRVVTSFKGQIGLINNPHRYASFMVLRAPDIPSILLEIGFLSNPEDEKRMLDPDWRDMLVARLVEAVTQYRQLLAAADR